MKAIIPNIEVISCRKCKSQTTGNEYLSVKIIDEDDDEQKLCDYNIAHQKRYKRGTKGTLFITVKMGKQFTNICVDRFVEGEAQLIVNEGDDDYEIVYPFRKD